MCLILGFKLQRPTYEKLTKLSECKSLYKAQFYLNYQVEFISAEPKKLSSSNCQTRWKGGETYKNKGDKKGGWEC